VFARLDRTIQYAEMIVAQR